MRFALILALALLLGRIPQGDQGAPVVILVSIDGFRADYLDPDNAPNLHRLATAGVHADYLETIFPSSTFPSHYTIVTGLYAENHGIVSNTMYDPELERSFSLSNREAVQDSVWWQGEPLWVTLQKQGRTAATYMWPGSEAQIAGHRPTWWMEYDGSVPHEARVDSVMNVLARTPRPGLVTLYYSTVDSRGHRYGPDSPEVEEAVREVDHSIGTLVGRLKAANLYDSVNLMIVGDHGMAATSDERVEDLADYLESPRDVVYIVTLGAAPMLNLKQGQSADMLLAALNRMEHVTWYEKGTLPDTLHYDEHLRIPDLVGVVDPGWLVLIDHDPDPDHVGGAHGYDPAHPDMHTLFLAHGPAFKEGYRAEAFSSVHIYELLCAMLEVTPAPNDGSLEVVRPLLRANADLE